MQKMEHLVKLLVSIHDTKPSNLPTYKYQIGHGLKLWNDIDHFTSTLVFKTVKGISTETVIHRALNPATPDLTIEV